MSIQNRDKKKEKDSQANSLDARIIFPGADETLFQICEKNVHSLYGDELPEIVTVRLKDELEKIKAGGWASKYLLAKKISDKSEKLAYIHVVRGSAGSSFAAFLIGITEVNPLPPHYRCPNCHRTEFVDPANYSSGFDLEAKSCPFCGEKMFRDGHNIPSEMFLGLDGKEEPDFEFHVADEIRGDLFNELAELFGADHVALAGVSRGYDSTQTSHEELGVHPGKILISQTKKISEYTPIGYTAWAGAAANPFTLTDFHKLKGCMDDIEIFCSELSSELRRMEQSTGTAARDIDISDIDIADFFAHDSLFGIFDDYSRGYFKKLPNPMKFSDIVNDLGFIHGTWIEGFSDGMTYHRDDVMFRLENIGISREDAYRIALHVGEGYRKGLSVHDRLLMYQAGFPEEYIDSLTRVEYLFTKAHSVSYAINYLRKIYYKIHYPAEFHAAVVTGCEETDDGDA